MANFEDDINKMNVKSQKNCQLFQCFTLGDMTAPQDFKKSRHVFDVFEENIFFPETTQ